jgi:hypothetical protein
LEVEEKKGPAAKLGMLRKMGLVDYAIDYAAETCDFEHAFSLAEAANAVAKLPDLHLKHAMHLEVSTCLQRNYEVSERPTITNKALFVIVPTNRDNLAPERVHYIAALPEKQFVSGTTLLGIQHS